VTFSALLDTCVLFPMYLRDSLLRLAVADLYRPLWSPHILLELRQALVREGATSTEQADRIIRLIRTNFPESEIAGYEPLMPTVTCHEKDRHVLAAALKAGTTLLITDNTADFPPASTQPHGIQVLTADQFLLELLDTSAATVILTLTRQAERYKRDPKTLDGLLAVLSRSGLRDFTNEVRRQIL
jgi:predicted nucleic acid-binding protein